MTGNTFGKAFTVTTFGESHGVALGCIVDGCPPGMPLAESDIQPQLDRRRPGTSRYTSQRRELDQVKILSGVFEGLTTGTPIGLTIDNVDQRTVDYSKIKDLLRPGHADYTYLQKYGLRDYRGGGRASARETAMRVAAASIARKYLATKGITLRGCLLQLGDITLQVKDWAAVDTNPFFCAEPERVEELTKVIEQLLRDGDSIGAQVLVAAQGVPEGLGEPVFSKLDADIAAAMMSINAVKAVEIGAGRDVVTMRGSQCRDELTPQGFTSNHSGGILGGISSGQDIVVRLSLKPTSSIRLPSRTLDIHGNEQTISTTGRHDPCVGIRAVPVAEGMLALVLMDHLLRHRGQNAEVNAPSLIKSKSE